MLLLLTGRTIRAAMSRRKPDARNSKRPPSKGGFDRRNAVSEGRAKGERSSKPPSWKGKSSQAAKSAPHREDRVPSGRKPEDRAPRANPPQARSARPDPRAEARRDQRPARTPESRPDRHPEQRPDRRPPQRGGHGRPDLPGWLYGIHACIAALNNEDRYIRRLLVTRETRDELGSRLPAARQAEVVDRLRLDGVLPPGAVHQGIALLADPLEDPGVESLREPLGEAREIVLLLDHVTDPRNVGAILRSAAGFGARAVVITDRHAPDTTGALAKAASGGLEIVPLIRVTNMARALDLLAEYGFWRVGLEMETEKTLAEALTDIRRLALVLGAEDEGLRRLTREKCDFLAKLPMTGEVESLNVSAAAAIALYEAARK